VLIVGGFFEVEPSERDAFIASRLDSMRTSRAESGCLEYTVAPDPLEPGRVVLFERWESQDALDDHLAALRQAPRPSTPQIALRSVSITVYDIAGERPLA
jgi:quinol monooxygenase YgiN